MKALGLTKETVLNLGMEDRNFPPFNVGDTIEISQTIKEGNKERTQLFTGSVISMKSNGISSTYTVRRIGANGIGVEKIFPFYSPKVSKIRLIKKGKVRRAKIHYIRERIGKSAKIKEQVLTKEQKLAVEAKTKQKVEEVTAPPIPEAPQAPEASEVVDKGEK